MSLQHKAYAWIGSPVGVSLMDGTGVSWYSVQYSSKFEIFSLSRNALSLNRLCINRNLYISLKRRLVKKDSECRSSWIGFFFLLPR